MKFHKDIWHDCGITTGCGNSAKKTVEDYPAYVFRRKVPAEDIIEDHGVRYRLLREGDLILPAYQVFCFRDNLAVTKSWENAVAAPDNTITWKTKDHLPCRVPLAPEFLFSSNRAEFDLDFSKSKMVQPPIKSSFAPPVYSSSTDEHKGWATKESTLIAAEELGLRKSKEEANAQFRELEVRFKDSQKQNKLLLDELALQGKPVWDKSLAKENAALLQQIKDLQAQAVSMLKSLGEQKAGNRKISWADNGYSKETSPNITEQRRRNGWSGPMTEVVVAVDDQYEP